MLEKYIFFVSKQPTLVDLSDIHQCVFSRVGASMGASAARTFDLKIVTKSGPEYTFTSINKEEHEPVETFLKDKKVKIKNEMVADVDMMMAAGGGDSDEEIQSVASSGDEQPKPRVSRDEDDSEEGGPNARASWANTEYICQTRISRRRRVIRVLPLRATLNLKAASRHQTPVVTGNWPRLQKLERRSSPRKNPKPKQTEVMRKTGQRSLPSRKPSLNRRKMTKTIQWTLMVTKSQNQSQSQNQIRKSREAMTKGRSKRN